MIPETPSDTLCYYRSPATVRPDGQGRQQRLQRDLLAQAQQEVARGQPAGEEGVLAREAALGDPQNLHKGEQLRQRVPAVMLTVCSGGGAWRPAAGELAAVASAVRRGDRATQQQSGGRQYWLSLLACSPASRRAQQAHARQYAIQHTHAAGLCKQAIKTIEKRGLETMAKEVGLDLNSLPYR